MVTVVSTFLATLAFLSVAFVAITAVALLMARLGRKKPLRWLQKTVSPMWLEAVFVVSLISTLGSLFFSEIAHYTPCLLCWYQRIFMYPLPVLAYLAIVRREKLIRPYLVALSAIGFVIAIYHNVLQLAPRLFPAPCSAVSAVSCAKFYPVAFDFVTIPMMSATAFLLLLVVLLVFGNDRRMSNRK